MGHSAVELGPLSWSTLALDAVMPVQFDRPLGPLPGEKRLLIAVLEDAVNCVRGTGTTCNRASDTTSGKRRDALAWMAGAAVPGRLEFEVVCHFLSLEPDAVRRWASEPAPQRQLHRVVGRSRRLRPVRAA